MKNHDFRIDFTIVTKCMHRNKMSPHMVQLSGAYWLWKCTVTRLTPRGLHSSVIKESSLLIFHRTNPQFSFLINQPCTGNHKSGDDDLHKNDHGHNPVFTPSLSSLQSSLQSLVISAHSRDFLFINSDDDLLNNSRLWASLQSSSTAARRQ